MKRRLLSLTLLGLLSCLSSAARAADDVTVTSAPSSVEYVYYEGAKPEKIGIGMKGLTEPSWKFNCRVNWVHYDSEGSYKFVIKSATCDISLPIVITLPKDPSDSLKSHEQGHLHINEYFYKQYSDDAIKKAAASIIGKEYVIPASSYDEAKKLIVPMTVKEVAELYRSRTSTPAQKANVLYDSITDHGRKTQIDSDNAAIKAIKTVEQTEMQASAN